MVADDCGRNIKRELESVGDEVIFETNIMKCEAGESEMVSGSGKYDIDQIKSESVIDVYQEPKSEKCIEEISEGTQNKFLDIQADKCKQRWESLRSQFRKICKTNGSTTGQAAKKKKKWRYENEMTFLLPHMMDKARVSSLQIHDGTDEENIDGNDEEQTEAEVETNDVPAAPREVLQKNIKKKRISRKNPSNKESASSTLMNYLLSQKSIEESKEKDSIDLFFDSIKATVRSFTPADFHTVKTTIFNVVSEIERKYLFPASTQYHHFETHSASDYDSSLPLRNFQSTTTGFSSNYVNQSRPQSNSSCTQTSVPTPLSSASSYYEHFSPNTPL
ncbi:uncharacterized protein isoform X2 [Leptinotarsa decemlineata]|uniref:uncharacterized protein isoform X2 n=1 Tax=Leptinotarsa decemlineata TaxID=7539 RepID=UPI003D30955A